MAARKKKTVKPKPAAKAGKAKTKPAKAKPAAGKKAVKAKAGPRAKPKARPAARAAAKTKPAAPKKKPKAKAVAKAKVAKKSPPARVTTVTAAATASDSNRRRFDRRNTRIQAQIEHDGGRVEGTVTNLSLQGCLFAPRFEIAPGARIRLSLAGKGKAVPATVKGVSDLGVHCLMHAGGATLGRLSIEHDDVALLMIKASRPHELEPRPPARRKG